MPQTKPSICFFSHSLALGGAERCLIDLIEILLKNNIKCSMVIPGEGPLKLLCEELNIPVKTYNGFSWWCYMEEISQETVFKNTMIILQNNFKEIVEFIQKNSVNAIYSQTVVSHLGAIFAEYLNLAHFWGIREFGEIDHRLKFSFGFQKSMEALFKTSQSVLSISKTVSKAVLGKNHIDEKVKINYLKVNIPDNFINSNFKTFDEIINIGIFGSINENKNQLDVLKAVLILLEKGYKIKLFIVGSWENNYYNILNKYLENSSYKNNITFTGHTKNPFEIMKDMNIVVSCSISEGFGRTLIEAILLKIPIIYANSGTPKEIYTDYKNALAYTLFDEINLSDKIAYTIENIKETQKRVEKAYSYVTSFFTEERYSKPIIDAVNQIKKMPFYREEKYVTNLVLSDTLKENIKKEKEYIFRLINDKSIKKVFFGASSALEKKFDILKELDIIPDYICDNDIKKHGKYFRDYEIKSPDEVFEKDEKYLVFITSSYVNEIRNQLKVYKNIIFMESYLDIFSSCSFDIIKNEYILKELRKNDNFRR